MLAFKQLETHGCVTSTVATDALVLKHQAISIYNAGSMQIVFGKFHAKKIIFKSKFNFEENGPAMVNQQPDSPTVLPS